jgi:flagellar biosynthesis/type III secretory pathway M-ring protein FliF/YscJ
MAARPSIWQTLWYSFWLLCFLIMALVTPRALWLLEQDRIEFEKYSVEAVGVVIEIHSRAMSGQGGRVTSDPEVRFTDADGRVVTFVDRTAVDIPVQVGQQVPVRYMPDDPEYARIEGPQQEQNTWLMRIVFGGVILLGFIGSFFVGRALYRSYRPRESEPTT